MTITVHQLLDHINAQAPFALAESWDNVGLLVGDRNRQVTGVLIGLDPTVGLLQEAIACGVNTVITHHPAIFKPIAAINTAEPAGRLLESALSNNLNLIGCHTNLDSTTPGVSDILAERLGLSNLRPLIPTKNQDPTETGIGRIGELDATMSGRDFLARLLKTLGLPYANIAGPLPERVRTVAVCGGSGSDLAEQARMAGADLYLTAEIKHNIAVWACECGFCIIDGTHWATERPAVALLAERLKSSLTAAGLSLNILQSATEIHPFHISTLSNSSKTGEQP